MKTGAHLFELYLHQISTDLDEIWCTRKQNTVPKPKPMGTGFGTVFCLRVHQISSKSVEIWWKYSSNRCAPIFRVLRSRRVAFRQSLMLGKERGYFDLEPLDLLRDVAMRWDSTYQMISRLL